jgi:hypothetical protein
VGGEGGARGGRLEVAMGVEEKSSHGGHGGEGAFLRGLFLCAKRFTGPKTRCPGAPFLILRALRVLRATFSPFPAKELVALARRRA